VSMLRIVDRGMRTAFNDEKKKKRKVRSLLIFLSSYFRGVSGSEGRKWSIWVAVFLPFLNQINGWSDDGLFLRVVSSSRIM